MVIPKPSIIAGFAITTPENLYLCCVSFYKSRPQIIWVLWLISIFQNFVRCTSISQYKVAAVFSHLNSTKYSSTFLVFPVLCWTWKAALENLVIHLLKKPEQRTCHRHISLKSGGQSTRGRAVADFPKNWGCFWRWKLFVQFYENSSILTVFWINNF